MDQIMLLTYASLSFASLAWWHSSVAHQYLQPAHHNSCMLVLS